MDVHAPHEPVHTWRDFATHLLIVTIGLFIALTLEAFVEYMHHRHLVHEARQNIRREIENNRDAAQKDLGYLKANMGRISNNIVTLHELEQNPTGHHYSVTNTMEFDDLSSAAWNTARDTGALGFMPYDEVQRYADLYTLSAFVDTRANATFQDNMLALSTFRMGIDPDKFTHEQFLEVLHANANISIELDTLSQIVAQYSKQCDDVLRQSD